MDNRAEAVYSKAVISGWAIPPEMIHRASDQAILSPIHRIDPLAAGDISDNTLTPLEQWIKTAQSLFCAADRSPNVYDCVIGYSLGGILALAAVEAGILATRQLIMVSSTLCFAGQPETDPETDLPVWPGANDASIKNLRRLVARDRDAALRSFFSTVIGTTTPDKKREDNLVQASRKYSTAALEWGLDLLHSVDLRPIASAHTLPVMILHGTEDEVIPAAAAARGSHILPNATPLFVNGGSHDLFHIAPDLLPSLIFGEPPADGG